MEKYKSIKNQILLIKRDLDRLFDAAELFHGLAEPAFSQWRRTCNAVEEQMSEDVVRVAVVGAIKSGKSSFINALLGADYLKRGAGVVTSIVTRIRGGDDLRATLSFKAWDEVNADIEQALVLFPSSVWDAERSGFDIRRTSDRQALADALNSVGGDWLIRNGRRNENGVLLAAYLEGYSRIADLIDPETAVEVFKGKDFQRHQEFVGSDYLAVYLQDVLLGIKARLLEDDVELADCQGSDSPNPLHLAMIQDYLLVTHFIIYVISSRTGLRQADIRFLTMIKKMGIMGNMIFLINTDFSEHESLPDLEALIERTRRDLSIIKPEPAVFTFSALYHLLRSTDMQLNERDRLRVGQWEAETELVSFAEKQRRRFNAFFGKHLADQRYRLLLGNHLERIAVVASGLLHWVSIHQELLTSDADGVRKLLSGIKRHQKKIIHLQAMVKTTLEGALQSVRGDLKSETDRFFDDRSGGILGDVIDFIRHYEVSYSAYQEHIASAGFNHCLYLVYQDFKQALDAYMTETVNPRVVNFIRERELQIRRHLESTVEPFDEMGRGSLKSYDHGIGELNIPAGSSSEEKFQIPEAEIIRQRSGLILPAAQMSLRYSARIKTEVIVNYGMFSVVRLARKIFKSKSAHEDQEVVQALRRSVKRIKREMEKTMRASFLDYRENIKFQYILRLLDAFSGNIYQSLQERFQSYDADLSKLSELAAGSHDEKQRVYEALREMKAGGNDVEARITALKNEMSASVDG